MLLHDSKNRFDPRKVTFGKQIFLDKLLKKMKGGGKGGMRYTKKKGKIEMFQESFFISESRVKNITVKWLQTFRDYHRLKLKV